MSGHSKWATIHRQKEVADQKRGQIFTKIANAIIIAVREGAGITDPESNFKLRLAIEKARSVNMPKENIQRAIDRAAGKAGEGGIEEVVYEGYGPAGVGIIVEAATDNKQRTVQEVKNIFDKSGGSLASPGAVSYNFKKIGTLILPVQGEKDELILKVIDLGAEDVEEEDALLLIHVSPEKLMSLRAKLVEAGFSPQSVEIEMQPITVIQLTEVKVANQVIALVDKLEALDDVQKVYANFAVPEEIMNENVSH